MVIRLFFGLCAINIVFSQGVLADSLMQEGKAHQEVLAVARHRLSRSASRNKSDVSVRLDHADHASFFFEAQATHPCLPGQDVCSSLLGHFRVDRQSGSVFDIDGEPERQVWR